MLTNEGCWGIDWWVVERPTTYPSLRLIFSKWWTQMTSPLGRSTKRWTFLCLKKDQPIKVIFVSFHSIFRTGQWFTGRPSSDSEVFMIIWPYIVCRVPSKQRPGTLDHFDQSFVELLTQEALRQADGGFQHFGGKGGRKTSKFVGSLVYIIIYICFPHIYLYVYMYMYM